MVFRKAAAADLDGVEDSYGEFFDHEETHHPWTVWKRGVYPTRQTAQQSLEAGSLYVLEEDGRILASVILNRDQPPEYAQIPWSCPAGPEEALVIHTLCVRPSLAGQGLGTLIVHRAMEEARQLGCKAIRLDTGGQNKPAVGLYTKLVFRLVSAGEILLDGQIAHPGHVFMDYIL